MTNFEEFSNKITGEFSYTKDYVIEKFPDNINFFTKKKWIKEKLDLIFQENTLAFIQKNNILWVILKDQEKYWMPYEKAYFYLNLFEDKKNCILIIEKNQNETNYYGFLDANLIVFTENFQEALNVLKENSNHKKIKILGVGDNVETKCHAKQSYDEISKKIGFKDDANYNDIDEILYLNESNENDNGQNNMQNTNDLFMYWFENVKNKKNVQYKVGLLGAVIASIILLCAGNYYGKIAANNYTKIQNS